MLVAALVRIKRIEAVTEDPRRVVRNEGVFAAPSRTVHRVERVEVDETAEAVGGRTEARGAEAVHRHTVIREAAEETLEASAVDPVRPGLELGDVSRPVRDLEPLRPKGRFPRREAKVGKRLRPGLRRPVRAVRRLAGCNQIRKRRAVIAPAGRAELLPVERVARAPAAGIVEL